MNPNRSTDHLVLLQWLIGFGIVLFALFVAYRQGLFAMLIASDRSYLSPAILIAFTLINLHVAYRVIVISRERNVTARLRRQLAENHRIGYDAGRQLRCNGETLPASYVYSHLDNLLRRFETTQSVTENNDQQAPLLDVLEKRIMGGHKYGWMLADLMIKLGLVGTVIGFVIMLGSVATLSHYDLETMQELLRSMSSGMRVALYTTLTGLASGLLLGVQYQFLEHHAEALLADIAELAEVHVIPALLQSAAAHGKR